MFLVVEEDLVEDWVSKASAIKRWISSEVIVALALAGEGDGVDSVMVVLLAEDESMMDVISSWRMRWT